MVFATTDMRSAQSASAKGVSQRSAERRILPNKTRIVRKIRKNRELYGKSTVKRIIRCSVRQHQKKRFIRECCYYV